VNRLRGWKNLAPYKWRLSGLAGLSAAEVALRVALPWPMKIVVDHALGAMPPPPLLVAIVGSSREAWLMFAVAASVALQAVHQGILMLHTRLHTSTGHLLTQDLRQRLFVHLQALSLRYHSKMPVGDAVHRVTSDATFLDRLLVRGVLPLVFSVATLVVMFAILVTINVRLAVVSLAIVPFLMVWIRWYTNHIRTTADRAHVLESRLTTRLHESFSAIRLVKSYAREPHEGERFAGAATDAMAARIVVTERQAWFSLMVGNLMVLGTAMVVLFGGFEVLAGRLTVGTLLLALAYVGFVYGPLSGIATTTGAIGEALVSARRVKEMFALATEVDDGSAPSPRLTGHVEVRRVTFSYDGTPVLRDISFTASPGELVAVVGRSGSGKTTLMSLIPRFYDPSEGQILLDGRDIVRYRLRTLREQIALVQQDVIVLAGSVRDNLRYGALDATDEEIEAAARAANAHDFIMRLPNGYDTELSEAGSSLSGGERQRLSIARAFLKNAPILILDEPTAALDTVSEALIFDAVEHLRNGRTTFVIAHRLSTVRSANRILVLDRGELVAQGTHDALLQTSALYRQLASQLTHPP
jgi:ABC-type multidrug transport system fused ATPase/permease subunit